MVVVESMSRTFQAGRETRLKTLRIKKPSIGEDDYKADLDSVNLIGRMQKGQSYDQAITSYYSDLQKDSTQREREFLKNKDWKQVRSTIYASILPLEIMEKGMMLLKHISKVTIQVCPSF